MSQEDLESQTCHHCQQGESEGRCVKVSSIAEIALAEAHVDLLVVVLHEGTSLLVVTGSPLHALPLGGDTVVIVTKVLVEALNFLRRKQSVSAAL